MISVIIPWCDREELEETVQRNCDIFAKRRCELVIVNCGGNQDHLRSMEFPSGLPIRLIQVDSSDFNKSLALNVGAYFSKCPRLLLLDADVILLDDLLLSEEREYHSRAIALAQVVESAWGDSPQTQNAYVREIRTVAHFFFVDRSVELRLRATLFNDRGRNAPGNVSVPKADFLKTGGMNSDLKGWGWEDFDLLLRLQVISNTQIEYLGKGVHLSHGDEKRKYGGGSPAESDMLNQQKALAAYNEGKFIGTFGTDTQSAHKCRVDVRNTHATILPAR